MQRSSSKPSLLIHQAWLEDIFNIVKDIFNIVKDSVNIVNDPAGRHCARLGQQQGRWQGLEGGSKEPQQQDGHSLSLAVGHHHFVCGVCDSCALMIILMMIIMSMKMMMMMLVIMAGYGWWYGDSDDDVERQQVLKDAKVVTWLAVHRRHNC